MASITKKIERRAAPTKVDIARTSVKLKRLYPGTTYTHLAGRNRLRQLWRRWSGGRTGFPSASQSPNRFLSPIFEAGGIARLLPLRITHTTSKPSRIDSCGRSQARARTRRLDITSFWLPRLNRRPGPSLSKAAIGEWYDRDGPSPKSDSPVGVRSSRKAFSSQSFLGSHGSDCPKQNTS